MIEDATTGDRIATEVKPVVADDIRSLGAGWRFDWRGAPMAEKFDPGDVDEL
jgi:hypothetical protein